MRSILFGLVVLTSTVVTTPVGAVTIDDFSVGQAFTAEVGWGSRTLTVSSSVILTGERDVTAGGYRAFNEVRGTAFEAIDGRAFIYGINLGGPTLEGDRFSRVDVVYDGLDGSSLINVLNTPFDITDGGVHDRVLFDVVSVKRPLHVELAFSPGDESEAFTLEKEISGPGIHEFKFDDFIGRTPGIDTPSLVSFFSFTVKRIGNSDAIIINDISTGIAQTPEPSSFLLLAFGLTIFSGRRRRKTC